MDARIIILLLQTSDKICEDIIRGIFWLVREQDISYLFTYL